MKRSTLIAGTLTAVCLAVVSGVFFQHQQLAGLRNQQRELLAKFSDVSPNASADPRTAPGTADNATPTGDSSTAELLQLRRQVGQLTARQRELAGVRSENERLRAQTQSGKPGANAGALPADYIRRRDAQWAGMSTPENTLRSFLWAIEHRDLTNLAQVLTPQSGAELLQRANESPEKFFSEASALPGMRIRNQREIDADTIRLEVEFVPGTDMTNSMTCRRINGEWKLDFR